MPPVSLTCKQWVPVLGQILTLQSSEMAESNPVTHKMTCLACWKLHQRFKSTFSLPPAPDRLLLACEMQRRRLKALISWRGTCTQTVALILLTDSFAALQFRCGIWSRSRGGSSVLGRQEWMLMFVCHLYFMFVKQEIHSPTSVFTSSSCSSCHTKLTGSQLIFSPNPLAHCPHDTLRQTLTRLHPPRGSSAALERCLPGGLIFYSLCPSVA